MVNNTQPTNEQAAAASGGENKQKGDCSRAEGESSPESKQDCHNVVKSSGLGHKRRFCCERGHKVKSLKVSVACQTDDAIVDGGGNGVVDATKNSTTALDSSGLCKFTETPVTPATALRISAPQTSPKQDDDGSKTEGTLRLMIHNFRNMNDTVRGPAKVVNTVPWKIMVMPRQHVVAKKGTQKCLGFFLQCFPESYSDSWSCQAAAELRLISQKPGVPNFVRKTNHVYTAKENDWGYSCFMTWADILDETQGYMKDENVILEVYVKAEPPKGILTHDQFCKKIQDYMRLADLQCSRNLIDKALEVNQTALKFCKDKDEMTKEELEKQRARLIEQKLKQSIERIEKGFTDVKTIENGETATNLNTLRQALAGNLAALKSPGGTNTAVKSTPPTPVSKSAAAVKQGKDSLNTENIKGNIVVKPPPKFDDSKADLEPLDGIPNEPKRRKDGRDLTNHREIDIDDPEAGTSDESGDDSDYEEIDEVCDSCLEEKLDHMNCVGGIGVGVGTDSFNIVETQENGCQTEPPIAKPRLPPVGASLDEPKSRHTARRTTTLPPSPLVVENAYEQLQQIQIQGQGKQPLPLSSAAQVALSNESEQKLLQLITEESKASLNTIKDTLERLVLLAQGGDSLAGNVQFELGQLKNTSTMAISKANANLTAAGDAIKTDVVEIPATLPANPVNQTQGVDDQSKMLSHNAKLVNRNNQIVGNEKRQQEQVVTGADEREDLNQRQQQRQHQQFVQTDLSFTPRAGSPTEDRTLLARAQAIVENKAEELVTKYSQLIEQSEANRLAETVKKVEKRMKDIEKQTESCRKELADECDRHYREEQKLIKANKQLKQQLDQANEKIEKLNNQLKDRRVELKKLEKRLKAESQSSAENAELNNKIEQLERDLAASRQKHNEDKQRWTDESQKFNETKRSLQQELTFTTAEMERLHTQLEEKSSSIRKLEATLKQERQQAQSSLKDMTERAKKAELSVIELRLDAGLKGLQRAYDECQSHIAQLEDSAKRFTRMQMTDEAKTSNGCLQEWKKTKDKIQELIQKAKNDFSQQMDAVKAGKPLAMLPVLEVPRPPPPPATPKLLLSVQTPPEQRQQHIAPIGTAAVASKAPQSLSQSHHSLSSQTQHTSGSVATPSGGGAPSTTHRAPSVPPPNSVSNGQLPPGFHGTTMTHNAPPPPANLSGTMANINQSSESAGGTSSSTYDQVGFNQCSVMSNNSGISAFSSATQLANQPSSSASVHREKVEMPNAASFSTGLSDFTPWATDPLNIMHTLIGTKGGFSISGFDSGYNSMVSAAPASSTMSHMNSSGQSGAHELTNGGFGLMTSGNGQDGQQHGQWTPQSHHQQHYWMHQSPAARSSTSNRSQGNGSPPQAYENRSDSPMDKRSEALIERLRTIFPNLNLDFIRDCIYEFRHYGKNFQNMSNDQLLNSAVGFIVSRQQPPKMGNWSSSNIPGVMGNAYDGSPGAPTNSVGDMNEEACAICGYALRMHPMCSLQPCSHVFHSACATQWLSSQRTCPTCGVFALPPEEYPDLS